MNERTRENKVRITSNIAGILALAWMIVIFAFSAQTSEESSVVSEGLSYRMVSTTGRLLKLDIDEEKIREIADSIEHVVRKAAHMTEYAILAVLLYAWINRWRISQVRRACLAAALAILYACSDEIHQLFVAGRSGRVNDVLIDSAGAILGLALFLFIRKCAHEVAGSRKEL